MKNILIKASGDVTGTQAFLDFVAEKADNSKIVVICGGGTKISKALEDAGFKIEYDEHGRVTKTEEERMIMGKVLEGERKILQDKLSGKNIEVVVPIIHAGNVMCPINGDDLVRAYYLGFDKIFVLTKVERVKKKKEVFKGFEKVEIIGV